MSGDSVQTVEPVSSPVDSKLTKRLSLVIPAFNEASRIEKTLEGALAFLDANYPSSELLLVDDGSTDATAEIATRVAASNPRLRVTTIPHAGKAAAVRAGMTRASGDYVVFSDADLATPLRYLSDFIAAADAGNDVVIGSREGLGARRLGEPWYRHKMGRAFNFLVQFLVLRGIEDTQCGFKLFRREAAAAVLPKAMLYRDAKEVTGPRVTAFDVEFLVVARKLGYAVISIPVEWTYGSGSKVNPLRDTLQNGRDILTVRMHLWLGHYG
jgi:dolichyl-phosphate beta-glucosyltransferase